MKFRPRIVIPVATGIITAAAIGFGFYKLARANSELSGAVTMLQRQIEMHRAAAEGRISKDPHLGFSEVIIDEDQKSYRPQFVLAARYTGNIFPPAKQDFILQTRSLTKNDRAIIWSTGVPLQIGDELELTGDQFYDLHAGGPARTAERKKFVAQSAAV